MARQSYTLESLRQDVAKKRFAPVYFLNGEESFIADEATRVILDAALTPDERGFNLDVVYGNESTVQDIVSHASSYPMMAERRAVVVRNMERLSMPERESELLAHYVANPSASTILILIAGTPDLRKRPYPAIRKAALQLECKPLYDNQIPSWILARVHEQGKQISQGAARLLSTFVNASLRELQNELDKLYIYIGERGSIGEDDVAAVVGVSKDYNVFALQNALGARDVERVTLIMNRMLENGDKPTGMIVMLTRFFTTLWKLVEMKRRGVSSQELPAAVGVNPFFLRDYLSALEQYSPAQIEDAFSVMVRTDDQLKTSSVDPARIIHLMLMNIMGLEQRPA
jgi:DNA polymerase III subunit delta